MSQTGAQPPPDAPKALDFPAVEEARQELVRRYQAMLVQMQAAMAKVLDRAGNEVTPPEPPAKRPAGDL